jgi:DNA-directed RNA polymerase
MENVDWYRIFLDYWKKGIERDVTKRPTMCDSYGITFYGIQRYVKSEGHLDWVDRESRGGAVVELSRAIQSALAETLLLPNSGKEFLKDCAAILGNANKHIEYTTPSGFKVVHSYNIRKNRRSLASLFNHKELTFYSYTEDVDIRKAVSSIAPNYIHSLDAAHMFLTIYKLIQVGIFQLSFIHDSFGVLAPYVDKLRTITKEEFYKIHEENQLQKFKQEIEDTFNVTLPEVPTGGEFDVESVLESDYFFA